MENFLLLSSTRNEIFPAEKKAFAIWLNAPLEAYKPKCIVSISIVPIKLQTTKGFLPTYYHYNLYSIKQPDFQLTFCKTAVSPVYSILDDTRDGVCVCLYARKGYELNSKLGKRKYLLASMSSLNRCKNTRLNCGVEIGCEHARIVFQLN